MALKTPQETAHAAVDAGTTKALLSWDKALVGGFLAGAYIAFGGLVAIAVSSGLKPGDLGHAADALPGQRLRPRPGARVLAAPSC